MILDLQTMFSGSVSSAGVRTGQIITATAISTNVLDLRNSASPALVDEGINPDESWLVVSTDNSGAWTAGGAATLTITLESSSTADLATSPVVHASTAALALAALTANTVVWRIPLPSDSYKRYLGLRYTVATGPFTNGAINANLTPDIQRNVIYPTGFTIDA